MRLSKYVEAVRNLPDDTVITKELLKSLKEEYEPSGSASTDFHLQGQHDQASHGSWASAGDEPAPDHLGKQIKDLEEMIDTYKDEPGGEAVVNTLTKNLKSLKDKQASGAKPYHGADLYKDPRLVDYEYEQEVKSIKETMDIVASVHEPDPNLQPVRVGQDSSLRGGVLGNYRPPFNSIGVQDINDRFSLVHELGHWQTLNPNFTLDAGKEENIQQHFLSNVNKLGLGDVFYRITQTDAIKRVANRAKSGDPYASYLATAHETYARAYAQYIAVKSGNQELRQQMEKFRFNNDTNDVQWSDTDFQPIFDAFDEYYNQK